MRARMKGLQKTSHRRPVPSHGAALLVRISPQRQSSGSIRRMRSRSMGCVRRAVLAAPCLSGGKSPRFSQTCHLLSRSELLESPLLPLETDPAQMISSGCSVHCFQVWSTGCTRHRAAR
ncbi:hypothetical protein Pden_3336 [Paracoccus denitrificans PD1222]|uniref:Uncharacterized protein n=1 Tax=Paracoccus denitrificans (strain Pd 1222) TaxID=318586 RepID=A1B7B6_PARDP|nr:hypothetical protein Pden_3336 [Paracoccus denitrificans PD1222]